MEDIVKQIEDLIKSTVEYGKTTIELTKLRAVDRISDVTASIIGKIIAITVFILFFLFASLGLALWLGDVFGKIYIGFFAVAGLYGLFGILMSLFLGKWIKRLICNFIIKHILR